MRAFVAAGALIMGAYLFIPEGVARDAGYVAVGLVSSAAMALGVLLNRPLRSAPWWLMAAGQLTWSVGDAVYCWYEHVLDEPPFPSVADALYLAAYPLLAAGLALLIRGRRSGRDREGLLD